MAKELFRRYDIHHLVVVDRKNVIGMVADRDLMDIGSDTPVQRAMAFTRRGPRRKPVTGRDRR
jgi:CBS domain-containing protein